MSRNKPQINFKYNKSTQYRTYHVDGVFGGVLPTAKIWIDIFAEKGNLPEEMTCDVNNDGSLTEVKRIPAEKLHEITRELQAGLVLDLQTAKMMRDWLNEKINNIEAELEKIKRK